MNSVRPMKSEDVNSVVEVHMDAFQGFFLTFLGPDFLRELYLQICNDSSGISIVYDADSVLGFVAGTVQPSGFYKRLIKKSWLKFGLASIKPVLLKPGIVPRLFRALTLPNTMAKTPAKMASLMSLAVKRECQRGGVGRQLVSSFLVQCQKRGAQKVNLTTDAVNNDAVNRFYLKMGFSCAKTFSTAEGRLMNEYIIDL